MNKTKIGWCDYSINPVKGLCPVGCSYCYARRMYKRFKWNPEIRFDPFVMFREGDYLTNISSSRIFIGSTIELFGEWIEDIWLQQIFLWVNQFPQHTFIFLTKRPENLIKWSPFPDNCWVGVSVTNGDNLGYALDGLDDIRCSKRFISAEPLLGSLIPEGLSKEEFSGYLAGTLDWVIIGQQTPVKRSTEPKIEWINEIVDAADRVGIPVFEKNNLKDFIYGEYGGNAMEFWTEKDLEERTGRNAR